jgi:polynucleotide 5'-hydroxyl-kinase GRC3/NOL9
MNPKNNATIVLDPGGCALVSGRGHLVLREGSVEVLGAMFGSGSTLRIRPGKRFPVYAFDAHASINMIGTFAVAVVRDDPIPDSWRKLPDSFLTEPTPKVVVLGVTDSGKSALTTYLANISLNFSSRLGVVDGDPGQGDIGPPTCVSGAIIKSKLIDLRGISPSINSFVGVTSPSTCPNECVSAVCDVASRLLGAGADCLLLNTDGWIENGGIEHKLRLLETIGADLVVLLGTDEEAEALQRRTGAKVVHAEIPKHVLIRSPSARYRMRVSNLFHHLQHAKRLMLNPDLMRDEVKREPGMLVALMDQGGFKSLGILDATDIAGKVWAYCGTDSFDRVVSSTVSMPEVLERLRARAPRGLTR